MSGTVPQNDSPHDIPVTCPHDPQCASFAQCRIVPQIDSLCECCGRDTPTTICLDIEGNAVLLCLDCQEVLSDA